MKSGSPLAVSDILSVSHLPPLNWSTLLAPVFVDPRQVSQSAFVRHLNHSFAIGAVYLAHEKRVRIELRGRIARCGLVPFTCSTG